MHSQEPILAIAALTPCRFISLFLTAGVVGNLAQSREMRTHRLNLDDGRISSNTRGPLMVCGGNAALSGTVLALNTFAWSIPVGAGIKMLVSSLVIGLPMISHLCYKIVFAPSPEKAEKEYTTMSTRATANLGGAAVGILYYMKYIRRELHVIR